MKKYHKPAAQTTEMYRLTPLETDVRVKVSPGLLPSEGREGASAIFGVSWLFKHRPVSVRCTLHMVFSLHACLAPNVPFL